MIVLYILVGTGWAWWLEWFTTTNLEGVYGEPWKNRERLFHWFFWPYSLATFLYAMVKESNNRNKGNE